MASEADIEAGSVGHKIPVTCGDCEAEFYLSRMKRGKKTGKCIFYKDSWITPTEFEALAGLQSNKKWRKSIKYKESPIGDWLEASGREDPMMQDCSKKPLVPRQVGVSESDEDSDHEGKLASPSLPQGNQMVTDVQDQQGSVTNSDKEQHECKLETMEKTLATLLTLTKKLQQEVRDKEVCFKNTEKLLSQRIKEQDERIMQLERKLQEVEQQAVRKSTQQGDRHSPPTPPPKSYAEAAEKQIQDLATKVDSLTTKQASLERESEKIRRKCNVVIGNMEESNNLAEDRLKVTELLKKKFESEVLPVEIRRVGKRTAGKARIILARLRSEEEKFQLLKKASVLKGSDLYLAEDLTAEERKIRHWQVQQLKKARQEGKRAFIRFMDGKLVVEGKVITSPTPAEITTT